MAGKIRPEFEALVKKIPERSGIFYFIGFNLSNQDHCSPHFHYFIFIVRPPGHPHVSAFRRGFAMPGTIPALQPLGGFKQQFAVTIEHPQVIGSGNAHGDHAEYIIEPVTVW